MFYIEAFDSSDRPILGNLDGQTVLRVRNYKRTKHYNYLRTARTPRVSYYKVVTGNGHVMEVF